MMLKGGKYLAVARKERVTCGKEGDSEKERKKGKRQKKREKRENTWTPFFTRSSQTNEAIKKCETSAVQSARRHSTVHKHNGGHGGVGGVGMVGPG